MDFVLIGVFQEMLTIPSVLVQPILLFLSLRLYIRMQLKVKSFAFCTLIVSLITMFLAWGSLIKALWPLVF